MTFESCILDGKGRMGDLVVKNKTEKTFSLQDDEKCYKTDKSYQYNTRIPDDNFGNR